MKNLIFTLLLIFCFSYLAAEPKLENYLMNDLELQRLALEFQKTQLSSKKNIYRKRPGHSAFFRNCKVYLQR